MPSQSPHKLQGDSLSLERYQVPNDLVCGLVTYLSGMQRIHLADCLAFLFRALKITFPSLKEDFLSPFTLEA